MTAAVGALQQYAEGRGDERSFLAASGVVLDYLVANSARATAVNGE